MNLERSRYRKVMHPDIAPSYVAAARVFYFKHLANLKIRRSQGKTVAAFVVAIVESDWAGPENAFADKPGIPLQSLVDGKRYIESAEYPKRLHILTEDQVIDDELQTGKNESHPGGLVVR